MGAEREGDSVRAVMENVKKNRVRFISLQFTDIFGSVKGVTIPAGELRESFEYGTWFDGSSIEGFTRIFESDMVLKPDPLTFRILPWTKESNKTARMICDVYTTKNKPYESDPRHILKLAMDRALKKGRVYFTGPEVEFFLLRKDDGLERLPHDSGSYFDLNLDRASEIREEMANTLANLGITVEAMHHEVAPGQHEIDFRYDNAVKTADNVITLKYALKRIAEINSVHATFMPKPFFGINGSGMHIHQSLANLKGKNVFFNIKDRYMLSEEAYHFIAGQLKHAKGMTGILAPTVNSYKRLVAGYEAPVYVCWGKTNRSALIRVPSFSKGKWQAARAELRCPDPSTNPYLAFAVMLNAGLDGIKNRIDIPKPVEENVYTLKKKELKLAGVSMLPGSLLEAINEMKKDSIIRDTLGEETFKKYINAKMKEWKEYSINVTEWEIESYLERA